MSVETKEMAQCLQNTTLISDILWPAIHVLSSSNLKITHRHYPNHHKYYEFKGLILAFLSVVLSRGLGGGAAPALAIGNVFADPDSGFLRTTIPSPIDGSVSRKIKEG